MGMGAFVPSGAGGCTTGFAMVEAGDEAEASPQGSSADLPFFGTPSFSFFGGVPLDLVVTPAGCGDSRTGCLLVSLLSERVHRRSVWRGGEVSPAPSQVASESTPSTWLDSSEELASGSLGSRRAPEE